VSTVAYSKPIPVIAAPDVLVCGAGLAGLGAAVAAARQGASVWAVDRMGFAGGFFTNVIGSAFDGFVFEMLERMAVIPPGTGPDHAYNVNGDFTEVEKHPDRLIPRCDPERFKRAADDILLDAGVHPLFHTQVADVVVDGDRIDSVILSNKAGLIAVRPKTVIDTTGDGDVAAWTGCPYEKAESLQPMALHFRIDHVELTFELRRRCAAVLEKARAAGHIGPYGGPWPATFSGRDIYSCGRRSCPSLPTPTSSPAAPPPAPASRAASSATSPSPATTFARRGASTMSSSSAPGASTDTRSTTPDTTTCLWYPRTTSPMGRCCRRGWTTCGSPDAATRPPRRRSLPAA